MYDRLDEGCIGRSLKTIARKHDAISPFQLIAVKASFGRYCIITSLEVGVRKASALQSNEK
jgi:hypothetical protein